MPSKDLRMKWTTFLLALLVAPVALGVHGAAYETARADDGPVRCVVKPGNHGQSIVAAELAAADRRAPRSVDLGVRSCR